MIEAIRRGCLEGAGLIERGAPLPDVQSPYALTDRHASALERAIRYEGYDILADTDTGEIKLVKKD